MIVHPGGSRGPREQQPRRSTFLKPGQGPIARDLPLNSLPTTRRGKVVGLPQPTRSCGPFAGDRGPRLIAMHRVCGGLPALRTERAASWRFGNGPHSWRVRRVISIDCGSIRNHGSRTRLLKDAVHVLGAVLLVVPLRECARVEKVVWQITALAGERSRPRKGSREWWRAPV